jgi:hypothetical protein
VRPHVEDIDVYRNGRCALFIDDDRSASGLYLPNRRSTASIALSNTYMPVRRARLTETSEYRFDTPIIVIDANKVLSS